MVQLLALLATGLSACATDSTPRITSTEEERSIHQFYAAWFESVERGDPEATLSLLHDEFVIKGPVGPRISDRKKLFEALSTMHLAVRQNIDWKLEESSVHGDWAWARVTEMTTHSPKSGGAPTVYRGSHLSILRRSDGRWKLYRDQGSLDELPPAP